MRVHVCVNRELRGIIQVRVEGLKLRSACIVNQLFPFQIPGKVAFRD